MNQEHENNKQAHEQPAETPPPQSPADQPASSAELVEQELTVLRTEFEEQRNRLLRVAADYQNYVRRTEQNLKAAREQVLMDITRSLITVLDHFDQALQVDPAAATTKSVLDGMQIVRDQLLQTLERFGVQRLEVQAGEAFDPQRHEAIIRQAAQGVPTNHVAAQMRPGYLLGDKTLRPAQVSVAE